MDGFFFFFPASFVPDLKPRATAGNYLMQYLVTKNTFEGYVAVTLAQLIGRVTKLGWFDAEDLRATTELTFKMMPVQAEAIKYCVLCPTTHNHKDILRYRPSHPVAPGARDEPANVAAKVHSFLWPLLAFAETRPVLSSRQYHSPPQDLVRVPRKLLAANISDRTHGAQATDVATAPASE